MNPRRASKHIVDSISTRLGNMRRVSSGLRSKRQERARKLAKLLNSVRAREANLEDEVEPTTAEARCHQVYLLIIDTENMEGISFTDISGPLPYTSVRGYRYIFFLYSKSTSSGVGGCGKAYCWGANNEKIFVSRTPLVDVIRAWIFRNPCSHIPIENP